MIFIAKVRRTILTAYTIDAKDEEEARRKMEEWDVEDEDEIDQIDWEIKSIKPEKVL